MKILPNGDLLTREERTKLVVPDISTADATFDDSFSSNFPGVTTVAESISGNVSEFFKRLNRESVSTSALVCNQMNIVHATGCALDDIASLFGISRHAKTSTVVKMTFVGTEGTVIAAGTEVTDDSKDLVYRIEDTVTIPSSGTVRVYAYNTVKGAVEIGKNILVNLVIPNGGISYISNDVGVTGRDEETDEQLRIRIYMQRYSGTALLESIKSGLLGTDGVNSCYCEENKTDLYRPSSTSGLDTTLFKGFAVEDPSDSTTWGINVYPDLKPGSGGSGQAISGNATVGAYVFYRTIKDPSGDTSDTRNYENKILVWTSVPSNNTTINKWVALSDTVVLRPHSIWCVVFGGDEGNIAQTLFTKKSSGSDYTALGESVPSRASYDRQVSYIDVDNGISHEIRFTRPEEISYSVEVDVIRHLYEGSDVSLRDAIQNSIEVWQSGSVFGVDGLSVGDSIYSYEVGAAVSEKIPEIKIKKVSIVKMLGVLTEDCLLTATCTDVSNGSRSPVYSKHGTYDVKFDDCAYLDYDFEGQPSRKNHLSLVKNVEVTSGGVNTMTPLVQLKDIYEFTFSITSGKKYVIFSQYTTTLNNNVTTTTGEFATLLEAWNAAQNGEIISQYVDDTGNTENITLSGGKVVILDMNGCSFSTSGKFTIDTNSTLRICNNKTVTNRIFRRQKYAPEGTSSGTHNGWFTTSGDMVINGTLALNGSNVNTSSKNITGQGTVNVISGYLSTAGIKVGQYSQSGGKVSCTQIDTSGVAVSGGYLIGTTTTHLFSNGTPSISGGYIKGNGHLSNATSLTGKVIINMPGYIEVAGIKTNPKPGVYKFKKMKEFKCLFCDYPSRTDGGSIADYIKYNEAGYSFSSYFISCGIRQGAQEDVSEPVSATVLVSVNGENVTIDKYGAWNSTGDLDVEIYQGEDGLPAAPKNQYRTYQFQITASRVSGAIPQVYPGSDQNIVNLQHLSARIGSRSNNVDGFSVKSNKYTTAYGIGYEEKELELSYVAQKMSGDPTNKYRIDTGVIGKEFYDALKLKPYQIGTISSENIGILLEDE